MWPQRSAGGSGEKSKRPIRNGFGLLPLATIPPMFGSDWEPATARIVAKKFKEGGERSGVWEYVADIMPASGAPAFRAKLSQPPLTPPPAN